MYSEIYIPLSRWDVNRSFWRGLSRQSHAVMTKQTNWARARKNPKMLKNPKTKLKPADPGAPTELLICVCL